MRIPFLKSAPSVAVIRLHGTIGASTRGGGLSDAALAPPGRSHVGAYGATLFASALQRVAVINNMPTGPRTRWAGGFRKRAGFVFERVADLAHNWLHGSIQDRQAFLRRMSADPALTARFDRFMFHVYSALLFLVAASGAFLWSVQA